MDTKSVLGTLFGLACLVSATLGQAPFGYPAVVKTKPLYASYDLRGKSGPKLIVQTWIDGAGNESSAPKTEGKVILLDFWATWCPPCRETIPELDAWQQQFKDDLVVIGITDEARASVQKFLSSTKMGYAIGLDTLGRTSKKVGVKGIPHALLITPDGVVRWQGFPLESSDPLTSEKIAETIAAWKASKK